MRLDLLKVAIKKSGLTKAEIAQKSDISRTTLDNLLAGMDVRISTIENVAHTIGTSPAEFFREDDNKQESKPARRDEPKSMEETLQFMKGIISEQQELIAWMRTMFSKMSDQAPEEK